MKALTRYRPSRRLVYSISLLVFCGVLVFSGFLALKGMERERVGQFLRSGYVQVEAGATREVVESAQYIKKRTLLGTKWRVRVPLYLYEFRIDLAEALDMNGMFVEIDRLLCLSHFKDGRYKFPDSYDMAVEACSHAISAGEDLEMNMEDVRFTRALAYIQLSGIRQSALSFAEQDLSEIVSSYPRARAPLEKIVLLKEALEKEKGEEDKKGKGGQTRREVAPLFGGKGAGDSSEQKGF